jgi:hypothetical protein
VHLLVCGDKSTRGVLVLEIDDLFIFATDAKHNDNDKASPAIIFDVDVKAESPGKIDRQSPSLSILYAVSFNVLGRSQLLSNTTTFHGAYIDNGGQRAGI